MTDVLFSVPTRGSISWETVTRLEQMYNDQDPRPSERIFYFPGHLSTALTRNGIVNEFLRSTKGDVLFMCDDDVVPSPNFLKQVIPMVEGFGMIGLPYPMINNGVFALNVFDFDETDGLMHYREGMVDGLTECDGIGTGCVVISREALEAFGTSPFRMPSDPLEKIVSEDFCFCQDLQEKGFKVGVWWDGWYADHLVASLPTAKLMERLLIMENEIRRRIEEEETQQS